MEQVKTFEHNQHATLDNLINEFLTIYPNFMKIQRLKKLRSQFYRDSFGFLREIKENPIVVLQCERISSKLRFDFEIPNGENVRNWVSNVILKFHDDPMVNESEIVVFLRQTWWVAGKRKGFERRREKNENEAKKMHLTYHNYLHLGYSAYYFLYIYLFIYLY